MRVWLSLLLVCSCGKAPEPTRSSTEEDREKRATVVARDAAEPKAAGGDASGRDEAQPASGIVGVLDRDGDFAPLTGTADFSSSGGVFVSRVETYDPDDAARITAIMEKDIQSLQPCLNDRRLAKLSPPEVAFHLDASGRASSFALPQGQQVPCLTDWIEGLDLGSPKIGKRVEVKLVLLVALE